MRAVDTNVLVRLLTRDDAKQVAAAEAFVRDGAWISQLVLMEAVWVLESVYELGHAHIANGVEVLLDHQNLVVENPDVVKAAVAQYRRYPTVGFSDCLIIEVARAAGHVPLATLDRKFGKLARVQRL